MGRITYECIRSLPFPYSEHKEPSLHLPANDLHMFRLMVRFASCFTLGKTHVCEIFQKPRCELIGSSPKPFFILGMVQCWDFTLHVEMLSKGPRENLVDSLVHSTRSDELHPHFVVVGN